MTLRALFVFAWVGLIAAAAVAGPEHKTQVEIAIDCDDMEHRIIRIDGSELHGDGQVHSERRVHIIEKEIDATN